MRWRRCHLGRQRRRLGWCRCRRLGRATAAPACGWLRRSAAGWGGVEPPDGRACPACLFRPARQPVANRQRHRSQPSLFVYCLLDCFPLHRSALHVSGVSACEIWPWWYATWALWARLGGGGPCRPASQLKPSGSLPRCLIRAAAMQHGAADSAAAGSAAAVGRLWQPSPRQRSEHISLLLQFSSSILEHRFQAWRDRRSATSGVTALYFLTSSSTLLLNLAWVAQLQAVAAWVSPVFSRYSTCVGPAWEPRLSTGEDLCGSICA